MPIPSPEDIRKAREAAGITQAAAAVRAGLAHRERWSEYEAGRRRISKSAWELFNLRSKGAA